ncbi:hypothetical protein ROTAS13_04461 [Roseomonas sp. TAS13]|nr:hypothetical protein ROTAS13_04461 [Roseomonas sp. TAS13]
MLAAAGDVPLAEAGGLRLQPGGGDRRAGGAAGGGAAAGGPVQRPLRSRAAARRGGRGGARAALGRAAGGECGPGRGPHLHPAAAPAGCGAAHQLLPGTRPPGAEDRQRRGGRDAAAAALARDLRACRGDGGLPPARRPRGARRHPLERPARGFPHRDPGPDEGAAAEERGDRADRREGRLRAQGRGAHRPRGLHGGGAGGLSPARARHARRHRQLRRRWRGGGTGPGGAAGRRRSLYRRRRRQGHGHLLRHRQRHLGGIRLLARRCLRLGRLAGIRPQGDGHHRQGRLGDDRPAFPRDGARHPGRALHRGRRRRHERRRLRQRAAGVAQDAAGGGLRPPPHLPRP